MSAPVAEVEAEATAVEEVEATKAAEATRVVEATKVVDTKVVEVTVVSVDIMLNQSSLNIVQEDTVAAELNMVEDTVVAAATPTLPRTSVVSQATK